MSDFEKPKVIIELAEYNALQKIIKSLEDTISTDYKVILEEIINHFYSNSNQLTLYSYVNTTREFIHVSLSKYKLCLVASDGLKLAIKPKNND